MLLFLHLNHLARYNNENNRIRIFTIESLSDLQATFIQCNSYFLLLQQ